MILDEFIVTRNWTNNKTTYLKVTNREGLIFASPQELLNRFIGKLSFDPFLFALMKDLEQRNLLLEIIDVDIEEYDKKLVELRECRRLQGQKVKLYEGEREEGDFSGIPEKEIDIINLQCNVEEAIDENRDIDECGHQVERANNAIRNIGEDIKRLEDEIEQKKVSLESAKSVLSESEKYIKTHKRPDVEVVRTRLNKALEINKCVQAKARNFEVDRKRVAAQKVYDNYTKLIDKVLFDKAQELEEAEMPIFGLSVTETGVEYKGIPFSQLSSSEQLRVSLSIAMALNPDLKVIRITNGSLLDKKSEKVIEELAEKYDFQIWIEKVDDSGKIGFYIEEGEVVNGDNTNE